MSSYFPNGQTVVLRYIGATGQINWAMPCEVISDTRDRTVLFSAVGTRYKRADWDRAEPHAPRITRDVTWTRHHTLRIMFPGQNHSVWLFWNETDFEFTGWYVNIEAPYTRTAIGLDTRDFELDVVVDTDFNCRLKDEVDLKIRASSGIYSEQGIRLIRAAADRAIQQIERRDAPFNEDWPLWRPRSVTEPVALPDNWDLTPAVPSDEISLALR